MCEAYTPSRELASSCAREGRSAGLECSKAWTSGVKASFLFAHGVLLQTSPAITLPVSRKFVGLLAFLYGSAIALVAAAAFKVYGPFGPMSHWPPVLDFFSFILPQLALIESGFAVTATVALLALPPIARRSTRHFWLWSGAAGVVLALPTSYGPNALLGTTRMAVKFGLFSMYPVLLASAYYVMMRLLLAMRWLIPASSGTCESCGYILANGTFHRCPECGHQGLHG